MLKKIGLLAGAVLLASSMALAEPRVLLASGIVRVIPTGGAEALDAVRGMVLATGSEVKTGENGRVTIEISPGNTIRLRENGRIAMLSPKPRETRVQFLAGRLKGVFHHLVGGEKFSVEFSDNAVASVKGTEFGVEDQGGGVRINTFRGAVQFDRGGKAYYIPQGMGLTTAGPRVRLDVLGEAIIHEWMNDGTNGNTETGSSGELKAFSQDVKNIVAAAKDVITQMREDDFAAGRTMRDYHGNLTRVDQRIIRPNASTISFVNLCKRESYDYKGKFYNSNISSGPRFDYFEAKVSFSEALPDSLLDWPGYFSKNDNIKAVSYETTLSNGRPSGDNAGRDTLIQLARKTGVDAHGDEIWDSSFKLNGFALLESSVKSVQESGEATGDLWTTTVQTYGYDNGAGGGTANNGVLDGTEGLITLNVEAYAINNSGKNLNINDFLNSTSIDPIGLMKDSAIEGIVSASDAGLVPLMKRGNIDLVMTPDIVLAVVEKVSTQISTLSNSGN